MSGEMKLNNL